LAGPVWATWLIGRRRWRAGEAKRPDAPSLSEESIMHCARHPRVETLLTCVTCGTPICTECMIETPVGMKCPTCGRSPIPAVYRVNPIRLASAMAASVVCGAMAGAILLSLGGFGLITVLLGVAMGAGTGEVAGRASGGKRGAMLGLATGISLVVGGLLVAPHLLSTLLGFGALPPGELMTLLSRRPLYLLAIVLSGATAYSRLR
jgi:hypothetical protein